MDIEQIQGQVRVMECALSKIKNILGDMNAMKKKHEDCLNLLNFIAEQAGYQIDDLQSSSRKQVLVDLRSVYCYYAYHHIMLNQSDIGEKINRDRTTVIWGIQTFNKAKQGYVQLTFRPGLIAEVEQYLKDEKLFQNNERARYDILDAVPASSDTDRQELV